MLHGSREDQIRSVRRLYDLLSEGTLVYPGHGEFTTIGREKRENKLITAKAVNL
jgi:glyoxylase-like metal-dependent hydrolase (beta-lactamase superfamily II)